jgi:imidazole glycerol-phosphate synthase subunit HisH
VISVPKLRIGVLEVGFGNLPSLKRILDQVNVEIFEISNSDSLIGADHLLIPGVGSFASAMNFINERGFGEPIRERCLALSKPTLGICLGAQILLEQGFEGGRQLGVGVFEGCVVESREHLNNKLSHNGWDIVRVSKPVFGFPDGSKFDAYFNHDFIFSDTNPEDVCALTDHGGIFPVILKKNKTYAVQFHPEKSQSAGLQIIEAFMRIAVV